LDFGICSPYKFDKSGGEAFVFAPVKPNFIEFFQYARFSIVVVLTDRSTSSEKGADSYKAKKGHRYAMPLYLVDYVLPAIKYGN
jgi:hypothetical protein